MLLLIQRVSYAKVEVNQQIVDKINRGILALVCIEENDNELTYQKALHKLINLRIFEDTQGKINLSLKDINAELLIVPQFTLAANTQKGLRPSFSDCCPPKIAKVKFSQFCQYAKNHYDHIQTGQFGANMQVTLNNDGPITLWLKG